MAPTQALRRGGAYLYPTLIILVACGPITPENMAQPASSQAGLSSDPIQRCATAMPDSQTVQTVQSRLATSPGRLQVPLAIPVYVHVIHDASNPTELINGYVPQSMITEQIKILNSRYDHSQFTFVWISTDWVRNATWFRNMADPSVERAVKTALRTGERDALNLYITNLLASSPYLGCHRSHGSTSRMPSWMAS